MSFFSITIIDMWKINTMPAIHIYEYEFYYWWHLWMPSMWNGWVDFPWDIINGQIGDDSLINCRWRMASQFDSLLDFGDSNTGDSKSANNQMTEDFDPFSSPSPLDAKGGSGMDLMGEFNFDAQVRNGNAYNLAYLVVHSVLSKWTNCHGRESKTKMHVIWTI